ncbi:hypothetical protein HUG10_16585 [Halorarum halophilum]|uniref:Arylsulfotransferase (ASST) n=1 Tax=Halorarum halophilum TaxID=2743090 RepID=A0A7D5KN59_9EURY|nr:hypothetical protein [Halobaculum halophilum]QLG29055.1 hypothetical protein HUG10_16585 [Halobaculum halophilum]
MNQRKRLRIGGLLVLTGLLLSAGAFGGAWALAPDRSSPASGEAGSYANTSVLIGVQGPGVGGSVTELHANGTIAWTYAGGTDGGVISYQNVQSLEDGTVLTTFADDGYSDCGDFEPPCKRTGVRIIDPDPEPTVVSEWSYPVRTRKDSEVHDAERLPSGDVLVADMEYESIFVYDDSTGERTWTWNASEHYEAPPDPTREDWLHINDVDRIGEDRYLVSVRNVNQLLIVERTDDGGSEVVEVINEDRDADVLNQQHNPHWLGPGRVLVADSENHRVVELHRNGTTGEWEVAWTLAGTGGIAFEWPRDADRLPNGHTVITDTRNDRVVVVDEDGRLVRSYATAPLPYEADVLPYGERAGLEGDTPTVHGESAEWTSRDVPVLSTLLAGMHHVVAVPYWVSELHLLVLVVTAVLWGWGGWLVVRGWRG